MKKIIFLISIFLLSAHFQDLTAQWERVSNGLGNIFVVSLEVSGNSIFAGTMNDHGVYVSTNNGTDWTQTSLNYGFECPLSANGNTIFAGLGYIYGLRISTNNGTSWASASLIQQVFSLAANGNNIFAGTNSLGVFLSSNNGTNWIQTSLNNRNVYALAVNGNNIFAGGYSSTPYGVYVSTNNGTTWAQTSLNDQTVNSLKVNGNYVLAGTQSNGVYLSVNNGTNWIQTSLNNRSIFSLAVSGNNFFAGTYRYGVYVSNNNGTSWIQRNEGLPDTTIVQDFCILNNYIFAGTRANSVYRRPLSELVGISPILQEIPISYNLSQNFPNPFNPNTKIRFAIPKSSFTKLVVYDMLGREVASLVNEQLSPGTYEITWNASNYPSGVYYYKLVSGDPSAGSGQVFTETKKMILVK